MDKKTLVHYLHVNKQKGSWTIHNSKGCFAFDKVTLEVPAETVYKPLKKTNPKFFVRVKGRLIIEGNNARIIK